MARMFAVVLLAAALGGCAGAPPAVPVAPVAPEPSPCIAGEASYACQVERYQNVNVP